MSLTYGFYNSLNHDRKYNASQMSRIFDGIIKDGIFMSIGDCFAVHAGTGMSVNVYSGKAWFNHTWTENDTVLPVPVYQSEVVLNRIDALVLEVDATDSARVNSIKFIKGTPSSTPVAPTLIDNTTVHQHLLCTVYVASGVTSIDASNIENFIGTETTPFVSGVLETVSIDALLGQWQSELDNFVQDETTEFQVWFDTIKGQLGTDAAGALQNQIGTLSTLTTAVKTNLVAAINWVVGYCNSLSDKIGSLSILTTEVKTNVVSAINEVFDKLKTSYKKWINLPVATTDFVAYCGVAYVPATTYQIGAYVVYGNRIWKCKTANTTGTWDSTKWTIQEDIPQEIELYGKGYLYRAAITCTGVTSVYTPNVIFAITNAEDGNYASIANTTTDKVYIYAKAIPLTALTIQTVEVNKEVA